MHLDQSEHFLTSTSQDARCHSTQQRAALAALREAPKEKRGFRKPRISKRWTSLAFYSGKEMGDTSFRQRRRKYSLPIACRHTRDVCDPVSDLPICHRDRPECYRHHQMRA